MHKILLLIMLSFLFGCDDKPEVNAPSYMKQTVHHFRNVVPECFKSKNIATGNYGCSLSVSTVPATGEYRGHPTFIHNGKTVGGVTGSSGCRSSSFITLPVAGERYSSESLHHEICHEYDFCQPCKGGHPVEYSQCCPHWPYLRSLDSQPEDIFVNCVTGTYNDQTIIVSLFEDEVSIQSIDNEWIESLMNTINRSKDNDK